MFENGLSAPYLTKRVQVYHRDVRNNNLGPIFKGTGGLRILKNGFSAPCLLKGRVDFDQTDTVISFGHKKKLVRFW